MSCPRRRSRNGSRGDEPLELGHELGAAAQRQIGLDAILDRGGAQVLQARDLGRRERLERHVGQRRPAPLLERRAQPRRRALVAARPPARAAPPRTAARTALRSSSSGSTRKPVAGRRR